MLKSEYDSARNARYDFIKGILIFGVIAQHTLQCLSTDSLYQSVFIQIFTNSYDMPLFMLISGYFLKLTYQKYNNFKNILNKFTQMIVPVLLWNTVFYVLRAPLDGGYSLNGYLDYLLGRWFLWAAFICSAVTLIICQITKNAKIRLTLMLVISIGMLFIPRVPFNLSYVMPFFFIGFFFDLFENLSKDKKTVINFVSICAFIVLFCFWKFEYRIWKTPSFILIDTKYRLLVAILRFFVALFGSMSIMSICNVVFDLKNKVSDFFVNIFADIGKNTLAIYILQAFFVENCFRFVMKKVIEKLGTNYFALNLNLLGFVIVPILAFIAVVIINVIAKYIKKIPKIGKYLFGFKVVDARIKK